MSRRDLVALWLILFGFTTGVAAGVILAGPLLERLWPAPVIGAAVASLLVAIEIATDRQPQP